MKKPRIFVIHPGDILMAVASLVIVIFTIMINFNFDKIPQESLKTVLLAVSNGTWILGILLWRCIGKTIASRGSEMENYFDVKKP